MINALGISWFVIPTSLYITYFQRTTTSSRYTLGTFIGYGIFFVYLFSLQFITNNLREITSVMFYIGLAFVMLSAILTFSLLNKIRSEKLLP
ncbi:hypothetical protein HFC64_01110 [Saccharolobus solfataricus]|uniref:Uncharacterized protein n=1 Tax=Saccharolobus solfataricus TaxID=2287 RepID=A0A157T0N9_SACSO|nr:hypothetical protein [Saccharolobus solfataricus]QPG48763.1 hypothetical protein HFC64_01110 [Saccharolobus solfataricus]SAI84819.1 uncharacterised protein [Saccharolobus solfataricus]